MFGNRLGLGTERIGALRGWQVGNLGQANLMPPETGWAQAGDQLTSSFADVFSGAPSLPCCWKPWQ